MASADEEEAMQGSNNQGDERILVSVRLRPLNDKEASRKEAVDWECIDDNTIIYKNNSSLERSLCPNSFTFDKVFRCHCSTKQVYEEGAKGVVLSAVSGINSSVFAYGQTSSGKTFTMSGITEYTMEDIFDYIEKHKERDFHLKFSAMEIYNESVRDLLTADNSPLRLLDDPERGTVVEKLAEETLRDWDHFKELLAVCEAQRQIGETFLNEASSRSHQILRLTIESSARELLGKNNPSTLAATLNFVDLAGSERASQALSAGSRLKEGSHINRSLLTLGTVIRKLSKGQTGHIPYRDSKLTRILQSSLGGNARTAVICTMSPARSYVEQSRNTLLFASCAKEVTTDARVNVVMSDKALVKHLQRELERLESELRGASPLVRSDAADILKEKDFKIDELERRVKELTLRLDLALSQIHNLQQEVGEQRPVVLEEDSSYPMFHFRKAPEGSCSKTTTVVDHHSFRAHSLASETPQSPDRHSRLSYDEIYSISDVDENQLSSSPFEQMSIGTPNDASLSMHIQTPVVIGNDHAQVVEGCNEQTTSFSEADQYIVSEEPGGHYPSSSESGHRMSEEIRMETSNTFEILLQRDSDGYGSQSPNFVEIDPYRVSDEFGEQTPNSHEVDQYQISDEMVEIISNYDDIDQQQTPEAEREQTDSTLEEFCKEVQCIKPEILQDNLWSPEERKSLLLTGCDVDKYTDDEPKQVIELGNKNLSPLLESKEVSGRHQIDDVCEIQNLNFVNNSAESNVSNRASSSPEEVKYEIITECGDEECFVRLEHNHGELSTLKNDAVEVSQSSNGDMVLEETLVADVKVSGQMDNTESHKAFSVIKEITKAKSMDQLQLQNFQVVDTLQKSNNSIKDMKDVGLNPQNDLVDSSPWPADVSKLQREIINLWDACNIPLLHRTYFFLLFIKDDEADPIYMEVERRRLSHINDAFFCGSSIDLDGCQLTPGSSKRSLQSERKMLSKLMKRRLSSQERMDVYVRWGINLDSKRRSTQVAHRLWSSTIDMDHVMESADIVAKLIRFSKPQVPKEVFGLNLTSTQGQGQRKSFKWTCTNAFSEVNH